MMFSEREWRVRESEREVVSREGVRGREIVDIYIYIYIYVCVCVCVCVVIE